MHFGLRVWARNGLFEINVVRDEMMIANTVSLTSPLPFSKRSKDSATMSKA